MSTVATEAKKKIRKIEGSGLLSVALRTSKLDFLGELFPEDFEQERANFLLVAPETQPGDNRKFFHAASSYFVGVAKDYGYRNRHLHGNSDYSRREVGAIDGEDETQEEVLDRISQGSSSTPEQELLRRERVAQAMKVPANLSTGRGRQRARMQLALRDEAWEEDGIMMVHCGLCGQAMKLTDATIDHIIPRTQNGSDELDNLQLAHEECNYRKSDRVSPIADALESAIMHHGTKIEVVRRMAAMMNQEELASSSPEEVMERFKVSRATAWRIRQRATKGMYAEHGATLPVSKVLLSKSDRLLSVRDVSKKHRVSNHTARLAKERGWFEVNGQNRDKIAVQKEEVK